jgi:hypothetical protein
MASGYILVEGMRPGSRLEGLPLTLRAIERIPRNDASPDQPSVWTTVEFDFPDEEAERIGLAFSEVLARCRTSRPGSWRVCAAGALRSGGRRSR